MKLGIAICVVGLVADPALAKGPKTAPVTIQTIDSDTLVRQFWNPNPTPVEAIVLKRRQRAQK